MDTIPDKDATKQLVDLTQDQNTKLDAEASIYDDAGQAASDIVREFLTEYNVEIYLQQFPGIIDGLKKIHLRFLYALYLAKLIDSPMKSARAVAELMDLHPFGDASMYNAIVRLAQSWKTNPVLVNFHGNVGGYSGDNPAAMRYTELALSPFAIALFFKGINLNVLPMTRGIAADREPKYFIPALPTALLYDNLSIGYGNQSKTVSLYLDNIADLVSAYAKHVQKAPLIPFDYSSHAEKFLPEFPEHGILTNADDLIKEYRKGNFDATIHLDGIVDINATNIVIRTTPHGTNYSELLSKIQDAIVTKNSVFDKLIKDVHSLSSTPDTGGVTVTPKQGVHPLYLWSVISTMVRISGTYHPSPNYVLPDGKHLRVNYITLLRQWFMVRRGALLSSKRSDLHDLTKQQWIVEAQLIVVDHTDRVLEITRAHDEEEAVVKLSEEFKLTRFQAESLVNQRIRVLSKSSGRALLEKLEEIKRKIQVLHDSFAHVPEEISHTAQKLKKEFSYARHTRIPNYLGYVRVGEYGIVLYESVEEILQIASDFHKDTLHVIPFAGKHKILLSPENKIVKGLLHKYMFGEILSFASDPSKGYYTLNIEDGTACYVTGVVPTTPGTKCFHVKKTVVGLSRNGAIRTFPITEISHRQKIGSRGAATDLVQAFTPKSFESPFFVAHFNTKEPNTLYLQKIKPGAKKFITSPAGDIDVHISESGEGWFITPPISCLSRCNTRLVEIVNAEALIGEKAMIKLDIASAKLRRNPHIQIIS